MSIAEPYSLEHLPGARDLRTLEAVALDLALLAGVFIHDERPTGVSVSATKSSDLDVVTAMDTGSEARLRARLRQVRPDDAVLGEEAGITEGTSGLTWVLDPIDGTVNYLYDIPAYAVSVAVVVGDPTTDGAWRAVAAAVINPKVGEVFHARLGGGAWLRTLPRDAAGQLAECRAGAEGTNDSDSGSEIAALDADMRALGAARPLRPAEPAGVGRALIGTGFAYDRGRRVEQGRVAAQLLLEVRDLRRMGAAALDLCAVAAGRLDGYYESGLNAWDLAGGVLIVAEAGGRVSGLDSVDSAPGSAMVIAAGDGFFAAFHQLISDTHLA